MRLHSNVSNMYRKFILLFSHNDVVYDYFFPFQIKKKALLIAKYINKSWYKRTEYYNIPDYTIKV